MTDLEKYQRLFDENPTEGSSLLRLIIESNDVAALHSYIKKYPERVFLPTEMIVDSPFSNATADVRLDVLRVLLDLADTNGLQIRPVRLDDFQLLDIACRDAQLNTVKFLLDRSTPLGAR
jgi:chitinase